MSVALQSPEVRNDAQTPVPRSDKRGIEPGQILTLHYVTYESYLAMADAIMNRPRVRFTFNGETLEIKTTSNLHEYYRSRLNQALVVIFEEVGVSHRGGGSQTFRDAELERGFEPDQCYWIANWEKVQEPFFLWNSTLQPPPDLLFEIEVSRSAIEKLTMFAAYRVPEVWRFDETNVRVHLLRENGSYEQVATSPTVPNMPVQGLLQFLSTSGEQEGNAFNRQVPAWCRTWNTSGTTP